MHKLTKNEVFDSFRGMKLTECKHNPEIITKPILDLLRSSLTASLMQCLKVTNCKSNAVSGGDQLQVSCSV